MEMTMATTMRKFLTRTYKDDNNDDNDGNKQPRFLGNNQPWSDAFLAEGWWVISMMMKTMRMTTMVTTMRTFLTRTYDDNNDHDNYRDERPRFFRQQPTLVRCIPGRGVVGDFYDDDKDEDDNDGN